MRHDAYDELSIDELADQIWQLATARVLQTDEDLRYVLAYAFGLAPPVVHGVAAVAAAVGVDLVEVLALLAEAD